jgi:hypothetical protein
MAMSGAAKQAPPEVMLWSWFAEDDFRPVADLPVGVAYLALSLRLAGRDQVAPLPRAIPVRIPPKMYRMTVVRVDAPLDAPDRPAFSPRQRELAARMVAEIAGIAKPQGVQIDFDAPRSAWPFYRQLLAEVRSRIGPDVFLSMTALVSWCGAGESWMAGLPVDEIVPMAFSMGQATPATLTMLRRGGAFPFAGCRTSIGLQEGDLPARAGNWKRAYFFPGSRSWSPELVSKARKAFLP